MTHLRTVIAAAMLVAGCNQSTPPSRTGQWTADWFQADALAGQWDCACFWSAAYASQSACLAVESQQVTTAQTTCIEAAGASLHWGEAHELCVRNAWVNRVNCFAAASCDAAAYSACDSAANAAQAACTAPCSDPGAPVNCPARWSQYMADVGACLTF